MKEGSERTFGKGYNVLPIFKERLNAKTLITTPNSDVIYALGYLDLKEDGPIVIEVPPGLQGILDDFWQRPIPSVGEIGGRKWSGDVGLPGPDRGKGGKYLILPPDYTGEVPPGYFTYRSGTYGVFVFWRGFFKNPKQRGLRGRILRDEGNFAPDEAEFLAAHTGGRNFHAHAGPDTFGLAGRNPGECFQIINGTLQSEDGRARLHQRTGGNLDLHNLTAIRSAHFGILFHLALQDFQIAPRIGDSVADLNFFVTPFAFSAKAVGVELCDLSPPLLNAGFDRGQALLRGINLLPCNQLFSQQLLLRRNLLAGDLSLVFEI